MHADAPLTPGQTPLEIARHLTTAQRLNVRREKTALVSDEHPARAAPVPVRAGRGADSREDRELVRGVAAAVERFDRALKRRCVREMPRTPDPTRAGRC